MRDNNIHYTHYSVQILLHTTLDAMRTEGGREVNHHGKKITIGGDSDNVLEDVVVGTNKTIFIPIMTLYQEDKKDDPTQKRIVVRSAKSAVHPANETSAEVKDTIEEHKYHVCFQQLLTFNPSQNYHTQSMLVSRDEQELVGARKDFYASASISNEFVVR